MTDDLKYALEVGLIEAYRWGSDKFLSTIKEARANIANIDIDSLSIDDLQLINSDIGEFGIYEEKEVPLDLVQLDEEAYAAKDPKLNTPMKGDVKKFKVYVKDPKTGNVKKINFGTSVTRDKLEDPKRRKAFSDRHNCPSEKDKTSARYWACSTTRWWHKVMGGSPINARYW